MVSEWTQPLLGLADGLTIIELCARYWQYAKKYYSKNGKYNREAQNIKLAIRYLIDWYKATPVSEFGPLALQAVRQRTIEADNSRSYINAQIGRIKRMFKWGVAEELVPPAI